MKKLEGFVSALLAGLLISMSGMLYIGSGRSAIGAILFAVGLFTICTRGMALFTGRVGYWLSRSDKVTYAIELMIIWLGNLVSCIVTAIAVAYAKPAYVDVARQMSESKLAQTPVQTWILGVLCGLLMYIAVDHFRKEPQGSSRYFGIFLCVPAFILAGMEHVVADMFYLTLGLHNGQTMQSIFFILVCSIGNACGAWLIPAWDCLRIRIER